MTSTLSLVDLWHFHRRRLTGTGETEPLWFKEYAYEEPGLVVLEQRGDWFQIQSDVSMGWIQSGDPERFHSYEQLVQESLAYLKTDWSGALWESPAAGNPSDVPPVGGGHVGAGAFG